MRTASSPLFARITEPPTTSTSSSASFIVNATAGASSLEALRQAGADNLEGKILLDISNPIASGESGTLSVANTDSLAEQIQREFPDARVVKSLNTMNCAVMVRPELVRGDHVVFVSSDHDVAKAAVTKILGSFGWPSDRIIDLGPLSTARGTEALLILWLPTWQALGRPRFNWAIQTAAESPTTTRARRFSAAATAELGSE